MTSQFPIFGIGTVVMDHVVTLPAFPTCDTKTPVDSSLHQIGGPIPVALSVASHYGAATGFCGRWGNDSAGDKIREGLTMRGIDLSACQSQDDWSSGFAHVWVDSSSGQRTIAYSRGEFPPPAADELDGNEAFRACQILHVDGTFPVTALHAAQIVKRRGGQVVLDAGSKKPGMEDLLPLVDVLIASDEFCRRWFGTREVTLSQLRDLGPATVIHTLGERGTVFDDGSGEVVAPAAEIEAVDTNGAGDIFSGAIVYGLSCEWPLKRAVEFANAAAAYACCYEGNSTWMPLEDQQ